MIVNARPAATSWPRLSAAVNAIFEARELLGADRAPRMEFARRYPDLGAEAELAAVGELCRGVGQDDGGIDLAEEFARGCVILAHDRVGVARAVILDVRDRI